MKFRFENLSEKFIFLQSDSIYFLIGEFICYVQAVSKVRPRLLFHFTLVFIGPSKLSKVLSLF